MSNVENFIEILLRKLKWKEKEFQDSIQYWKDNPDEWSEDSITTLKNYLQAFTLCRGLIEESTRDLQHQQKFDEFVETANDILDEIKRISETKRY